MGELEGDDGPFPEPLYVVGGDWYNLDLVRLSKRLQNPPL